MGAQVNALQQLQDHVFLAFTPSKTHVESRGSDRVPAGHGKGPEGSPLPGPDSSTLTSQPRSGPKADGRLGEREAPTTSSNQPFPDGTLWGIFHKRQLSAVSEYWGRQLEGPWGEHALCDTATGWPVLMERGMSAEEMAVVPLLLHFLSSGQLEQAAAAEGAGAAGSTSPAHTSVPVSQICQVFRLAGRFRLPGCARACVQALQALDPGRLTEQEVLEVMQLPADQGFKLGPGADTPMGLALGAAASVAQLHKVYAAAEAEGGAVYRAACLTAFSLASQQMDKEAPGTTRIFESALQAAESSPEQLQQVKDKCTLWLVRMFGDVSRVLNSWLPRWQFNLLGFAMVVLWAGSDKLQVVASENEVVAALDGWVRAQPADSLSAAQQQQLSACVRVKQLTRGYRLFALPKVQWFQPQDKLTELSSIIDCKQATAWPERKQLVQIFSIPPAWVGPARALIPGAEAQARQTIQLSVSKQKLEAGMQQALRGEAWSTLSPNMHIGGHEFNLQLTASNKNGRVQFGLHLHVIDTSSRSRGNPMVYARGKLRYQRQQQLQVGAPPAAAAGLPQGTSGTPGGNGSSDEAKPASVQASGSQWVTSGHFEYHYCKRQGWGYPNFFKGQPLFGSVGEMEAQGFLVGGMLQVCCRLLVVD